MIEKRLWSPSGGIILEPNAELAVKECGRNVALTAGPGAGKTEMLAQRADFLLRTGSARCPTRILAISFKVDASRNLWSRVNERCGHELGSRLDSFTFHAFAKSIIDRFRVCLTGTDALDRDYTIGPSRIERQQIQFEDMVPLAVRILETSQTARNGLRQTYSHVFLDEFQDCTTQQYRLVSTAFGDTEANLIAVGDTKQRIMGWAGALEGVFEKFAAEFDALPLNLYQNFRSEPRLRRVQNAMIKVMEPSAASSDSDLEGSAGQAQVLSFVNDDEEADGLARRIKDRIQNDGVEPSEIAVLVSRQPELYTPKLFDALERLGIPTRNEKEMQDLYSEPVVQLVTDFLKVILGHRESHAYRRTMTTLCRHSTDDESEIRLRTEWQRFIDSERQMLSTSVDTELNTQQLAECIDRFVGTAGDDVLVSLSPDYEHSGRLTGCLDQMVARLGELIDDGLSAGRALSRLGDSESVRVMTIHKSKGLEFDTVVVLGVEQETFWGDAAAERPAFFVAISRAKRLLLASTAGKRSRPNGAARWVVNRTPHREFVGYIEQTA